MKRAEFVAIGSTIAVAAVIELLIKTEIINPYWELIIQYACIMTVLCLGLNIIYGFNGQFSLGHVAFYGIGAYASAIITKSWTGDNSFGFFGAIVVGGVVAALVAFLIGLPILRLRSDYLGIATLGFGFIVKVFFDNADSLLPIMGGARGMTAIPKITSFPWVAATAIIGVILMRNFLYSSPGRATLAIREDEIAAVSMGVNATKYKTFAFVLGCTYAGVAGALYAHLYSFLHPSNFDFIKSFDPLLIVVLGGLGSISGTIIAAVGWTFLLEGLRVILPQDILDFRYVIYPLLLIIVMVMRPTGLMGGTELSFLRAPKILRREAKPQRAATESR
ncbi:MAG TPA: branched-chain amino acid ABC transporter permease [Chloroflexota bacterium]